MFFVPAAVLLLALHCQVLPCHLQISATLRLCTSKQLAAAHTRASTPQQS
jgi:hypothetical protein